MMHTGGYVGEHGFELIGEHGACTLFWFSVQQQKEPLTDWERITLEHKKMAESTIAHKYYVGAIIRLAIWIFARTPREE
jgi:hypothetical protein